MHSFKMINFHLSKSEIDFSCFLDYILLIIVFFYALECVCVLICIVLSLKRGFAQDRIVHITFHFLAFDFC